VPAGLIIAPTLASNASSAKPVVTDGGGPDVSSAIARRALPPEPRPPTGLVNCIRSVSCPQEQDDTPVVPFPPPYEKCLPTVGKSDAAFSKTETETRRQWDPHACCYVEYSGCSKQRSVVVPGRPLRSDDGALVTAPSVPRSDWLDPSVAMATPDEDRAQTWMDAAAAEHASVAAFARVSLELLALGAPPDLIADVHAAALDEIEHARICFALAARFGAQPSGPAPLAMPEIRAAGLADVARSALLDGFANEAAAAAEARARSEDEADPVVRAALEKIALDEERHAALGLRIAMWALERSPVEIACIVSEAIATLEGDPSEIARVVALPCVRALLPWLESRRGDDCAPVA
jgi:hypothetical protein